MAFYKEADRLTHREARILVGLYLNQLSGAQHTVTTVAILREVGLRNTTHNRNRIRRALSEKAEPEGASSCNARVRFRVTPGVEA